MVQREFFDNYVTNMQVEDTCESERLAWIDEWGTKIQRDCDILVDCDKDMELLSRKVFGLDGIKIRKDKKIAEQIVPAQITIADTALREELFCRILNNRDEMVSVEHFNLIMKTESPLDFIGE